MRSQSKTVTVNIIGDSSSAQRAITQIAEKSESAGSRISGAFKNVFGTLAQTSGGAFAPLAEVLDSLEGKFEGLKLKAGDMGKAFMAGGAGVAGAGATLAAFGSKEQAATQQLSQAISTVGGSYDDYKDKIEQVAKSQAKYGTTSDQVKDALAQLTLATKDPAKALDLMQTAANLAATKHESLATATDQLVKVIGGKGTRTLAELGIQMTATGKSGLDVDAALKAISERVNGQAAAAADTFTGKLREMRAEVENHVAEFGQRYGPAITAAGAGMSVFGGVIEGASAVIGKFKTAQEAQIAVQQASNVAMDEGAVAEGIALGPILLIIAAVAALGVGIYELVTHWSTVWGTIKSVVGDAWHFIDGTFIQPIEGFFSTIVGFVERNWKTLAAILIAPLAPAIFIFGIFHNQIIGFFENIGEGIKNAFRAAFDFIARGWNDTVGSLSFHIPSWVPGLSGDGFSMPKIPLLALGTDYFGGGMAIVGEAGPELVALPRGSAVHSNGSPQTQTALAGGPKVVNHITAITNASATDIANEISFAMSRRIAI